MENKTTTPATGKDTPTMSTNKNKQGVDKAPGEEQGKKEQVTDEDLKGKKVDRDITDPKDEPLKQ
jgi:hypothetical protein